MENEIKTVQDYLMAILPYQQRAQAKPYQKFPRLLYRGQTDRGDPLNGCQLIATLKQDWRKNLADKERKVITKIKVYLKCHRNREYTDWEVESIARHYEVPTRFLDWSSNCLTALWFSISQHDNRTNSSMESDKPDMSSVWILAPDSTCFNIAKKETTPIPQAPDRKTKIFWPRGICERAERQDSYMMRQVFKKNDTAGVEKEYGDAKIISVESNASFKDRCWLLPITNDVDVRKNLRAELRQYGYDDKALFPDDSELYGSVAWNQLLNECNEILDMNN